MSFINVNMANELVLCVLCGVIVVSAYLFFYNYREYKKNDEKMKMHEAEIGRLIGTLQECISDWKPETKGLSLENQLKLINPIQ